MNQNWQNFWFLWFEYVDYYWPKFEWFLFDFLVADASLNEVKATLLKSLSPFAQYPGAAGSIGGGPIPGIQGRGGCPLCDSSVYSYCSDRMIHDGCCCNAGNG